MFDRFMLSYRWYQFLAYCIPLLIQTRVDSRDPENLAPGKSLRNTVFLIKMERMEEVNCIELSEKR